MKINIEKLSIENFEITDYKNLETSKLKDSPHPLWLFHIIIYNMILSDLTNFISNTTKNSEETQEIIQNRILKINSDLSLGLDINQIENFNLKSNPNKSISDWLKDLILSGGRTGPFNPEPTLSKKIEDIIQSFNNNDGNREIAFLLIKEAQNVGEIHNKVLEKVFENISTLGKIEKNNLNIISESEITDFIVEYFERKISKKHIELFYNQLNNKIEKEQLTESQNLILNYTNDFEKIVDKDLSVKSFNSEVQKIINEASKSTKISSDNLKIISIIGSVAKHSNDYWRNKSSKWKTFQENPQAQSLKDGYEGRIIKADIRGAGTGAITGAIGGAFVGGIGALPGGIFGGMIGACRSSTIRGLREYFGW
ncbi:hypothetical protein [Psychroserpens mesophilus]|uniref:hypothetical protein n=1 Tax=Psychroserpens mesophilus TaxID=325473 RepID=UPI00058D46B8|nr:hypothetical protein [Psychroserpens mesophilus]